jgi:hypothetical protein
MPKLLNISENWAFGLSVNLYENTKKVAEFLENLK